MKNKKEICQVIYYALYLNDIFYLLCLIKNTSQKVIVISGKSD